MRKVRNFTSFYKGIPKQDPHQRLTTNHALAIVKTFNGKRKMASMKDVARIAGVSIATVSRVLNDKSGSIPISKETRDRVLAVVDKINYRPNYAAQRLRSHNLDHSIGVYVPWGWGMGGLSSFVAKLLESVGKCIHNLPYNITLLFYEPGMIRSHYEELQRVRAHRIDAMMIVGASPPDIAFLETVANQKSPPFLLIHRELQQGNYITSNNQTGTKTIVSHLINKGHKRIALISTPRTHGKHTDYIYNKRYLGYEEALAARGIPVDNKLVYFVEQDDQNSIIAALKTMMNLDDPPTGIFAAKDSLLISTLKTLKILNYRVPEDIALVSFSDNEEICKFTDPPVTSVVAPVEEMARIGVNHLIKLVDNGSSAAPMQVQLDCRIIYGESS